jgi:membrane-associated phospholipid phosphatase
MTFILSLENVASLSVLLVYIIPGILYYYTRNPREIIAIISVFGTGLLSEGIKHLVIGNRNPRPSGASDCDLLCTNGLQEGKPGMPSGHSALAFFFAGFYFNQTDEVWIKVILVIFATGVAYSRYTKRCHSIEQAIAGALFGIIMSIIVTSYLL